MKSSLQGINDLVGGLPVGSMMGIYGPAKTGKTILATQLVIDSMIVQGGNGFIIDTEGSVFHYMEWAEKLNKRFGCNIGVAPLETEISKFKEHDRVDIKVVEKPKGCDQILYVLDLRELSRLLKLLGRGCKFETSEKGKMALKIDSRSWVEDVEDTAIAKFMATNDVTCFAVDSVSYPVLNLFGPNQENFPARSQATGYLMARLQELSSKFRLVQVGIMHESVSPTDSYSKPGIAGGNKIAYSYKFTLYITAEKSSRTPPTGEPAGKRTPGVREVWLQRHSSREDWARPVFFELSSQGYRDYDVEKRRAIEVNAE